MKTLGVIGGMGPAATARFYADFVRACGAKNDQDNPDALIFSLPTVPDRTAFILGGQKNSPAPRLREAAVALAGLGAEVLAMPCVTAHYFYDEISQGLNVKFLHIIRETTAELTKLGVRRAGLLATSGTVKSGLFQRELEHAGIGTVTPAPEIQERLMSVLYSQLKAGGTVEAELADELAAPLRACDVEMIVLGCTELSLLFSAASPKDGIVDALGVLARRAAEACMYTA